MNDHFLLEAFWVLGTYGLAFTATGIVVSSLMVLWGSRRKLLIFQLVFLTSAIVLLWILLFCGIDNGYRAWQSIPEPPKEAFSDTGGTFFILLVGWLPSLLFLGSLHLLLRFLWKEFGKKPTITPELQSQTELKKEQNL